METTVMESTAPKMTTWQRYRTKIVVGLGMAGTTLAPYASAGTLNDSITPILDDMVLLFTPILNLVIAAVPLIIAIALVGFITGILGGILQKIRV